MDQSFDQDIKIGKINKYQLYLGDGDQKFLKSNLSGKFENFIKAIKYQETSLITDNNNKNYKL